MTVPAGRPGRQSQIGNMKTLDDRNLTDEQRELLAAIINCEGEGTHTVADKSTLRYFARDYAVRCVERALGVASPAMHERVAALWASL